MSSVASQIPSTQGAPLAGALPGRKGQHAAGRLLLVDDESNILRSLQRVLRRNDWEIQTAPDAESALLFIEDFQPQVVISDFRMPGMNGVDFLARVKALLPNAQRIMLTGQADQQSIEDAINRSEIFRFLHKPWNDSHLVLTVRSAFEQNELLEDNERLRLELLLQNEELKALNSQLEGRVGERTRALSIAKRDWEQSFDSIATPMAVIDAENLTVQRANIAFARLAGADVKALGGLPSCHRLAFGRERPCAGCPVGEASGNGVIARAEIQEKSRTYVVSAYPMGDDGRVVCTYVDVTDEREMTRRMVETEKMAAVGQLAGGVAHEINNPLGGILAFSQLMKRDEGRSAEDLESLSLIEESAIRCKRIVESLLKFSRRSRHEDRRPYDLSRCIDDAVVLFRAQLKSAPRAQLLITHEPGLPELHGDPAQLSQVLLNLLQNSLYALPKNEGTIRVHSGRQDEAIFFRVTDTGRGIPPEHLPHIFEPSYTTKPPGEGTGLGLAIAYRIVEDHGGRFEVQTQVDEGTTFTVLLPIPLSFSEHL